MKDLFSKTQRYSTIIGILAFTLLLWGASTQPQQFYRSYLTGYLFWVEISLGCLALFMIHQLTGGSWGVPLQRILVSGANTLWLMAPLFIPILFGVNHLFPWAQPGQIELDSLLRHRQSYLNPNAFLFRSILYFIVWIGFYTIVCRRNPNAKNTLARNYSSGGLVLYCFTSAFAAIDWIMSLEPHWYSTILGMIFFVGHGLSAMSFIVLTLTLLTRLETKSQFPSAKWSNDIGNLLLVFVLLWTYLNFSQFLITWGGNLPHEVEWYVRRFQGNWKWLALILVIFQFALPFFLLLFRPIKRNMRTLAWIAGIILSMRLVDIYWSVIPSFHENAHLHWMDGVTPLFIGCAWMGIFLWKLRRELNK